MLRWQHPLDEGHQLAPEQRSTKECEWKQGESAEGKKKTSSEKGRGGKAVAPPVGRRSALEDGRLKIFV
jgi:hypothetical protein